MTTQTLDPTTPATTGERVLPPLRIGRHVIDSPVVLAPMAGITNRAFRRLCREAGDAGLAASGLTGASSLYVNEMVTSRALVERTPESMRLIEHDEDERPRSVQLYSVDPATTAAAVRMLVTEDRADHIDLNFGCPVPKVTRKGGGAALPWKRDLFRAIVSAAVTEGAKGDVPVTVKMRKGIDDEHLTFLEAGRAAQEEGVTAVALHGRTAAQMYGGAADWNATLVRLARLSGIETAVEAPAGSAQLLVRGGVVALPLAGVIDFAAERARLTKEIAKTQNDIVKTEAKLANEDFVARAPEEIVEENRERLVEWRARVEKLQTALERVSG